MDNGDDGIIPGPLENSEEVNISDVLHAIQIADPEFGQRVDDDMHRNGAPADARPYIRILEEPATKGLRFRYECEGRSAGSIPGANSTPEKKSFPSIQICGVRGRAIVVVSCVTKDEPYRPHPHKLVGRDPPCKKGVLTYEVPADQSVVTFSNLGIQCVKKKDIEESLTERQKMRIDPYRTGYDHKKTLQSIDLNAIRLCFQVFLPDDVTGQIRAGPRAVSNVIYDKKAMSDLVITKLSHCSGPMGGGLTMILLCEKVMRDDIAVTFSERVDGVVTWEADASDVAVHKQVAIAFRTPAYPRGTGEPRRVYIHLRRPSDNKAGDALEFELYPDTADKKRKRLLPFDRYQLDQNIGQQRPDMFNEILAMQREMKPIKLEPRDKTSPMPATSPPMYTTPPPQHYVDDQRWMTQPGASHMQHGYQTLSPTMQQIPSQLSPGDMATLQPLGQLSPMGQASPHLGQASPYHMQASSPHDLGQASPLRMEQVSPHNMGSPMHLGQPQPALGQHLDHLLQPALHDMQQVTMMAQEPAGDAMDSGPSLSGLLRDAMPPQLDSWSGLSGLLCAESETLSDTLNRLDVKPLE